MNETPLLQVRELKKHFPIMEGLLFRRQTGLLRAVDGVSFDIAAGETLGLVGESGCGKSTTVRAIAQLQRPTAGEVVLEGRDLCTLPPESLLAARRHMQIIFQDPYASLDPRMTVGQIIAEPLEVYRSRGMLALSRAEINERVALLMERVGLNSRMRNRYPHEFSGGQRQRIGVARALALEPRLILADEPVSALDVSIQSQILNLLCDLQQELGLSYLFIAHDLGVVEYVSHRVAVMYLGRIVETASAAELYRSPLHPYTRALLSAVPIPDPVVERRRRRIILPGDVPSPDRQTPSCAFYERCPSRMPVCAEHRPRLKEVASKHSVACFLHFEPD